MGNILVALAQINPTVGALEENRQKIVEVAKSAAKKGATIIVFPELALSGYPPEDLILKQHFIEDCNKHLEKLCKELPKEPVIIVGAPHHPTGHAVYNAAVVYQGGKVHGVYHKMLLPNYGVFDEKRVFAAGRNPMIFQMGETSFAVHICEDSWETEAPPVQRLVDAKLDMVINLSASPYHRGKLDQRASALRHTVTSLGSHILYCNLVGGQDELVFDGASMVLGSHGELMARAKQFEEDLLFFNVPGKDASGTTDPHTERIQLKPAPSKKRKDSSITPALYDLAEVYSALKLGLRDYLKKNGFKSVVIALSGGIDSAIVATIAADALGSERVFCVTMPSEYTSDGTFNDAVKLAGNLGVKLHTVPIKNLFESYNEQLSPLWEGKKPDITEENIQARIRGNIIMALSNKFGSLVLATGNKSELATGYCTLYGDMVGGFAVIKDVPKRLVFALSNWRNDQAKQPIIPPSIIERPPSAELRPDQKDTDSLPPYDVLDGILERYVERDMGIDAIVAEGFDAETVTRVLQLVDRSEYKRRQGAPGIKITPKAFGRDRRVPITNQYRNHV